MSPWQPGCQLCVLPVPPCPGCVRSGVCRWLGDVQPCCRGILQSPIFCEVPALGRVGEAGLGSAQALRALTHGAAAGASSRSLQPLAPLQGCFMALPWHGASAGQGMAARQGHGSACSPPPWLGSCGSTVSVPCVHPGGVGSSGHGTKLVL